MVTVIIMIHNDHQMLAWPAVALGYFGLSYGSSSMEGDFFVNSVF